MESLKTFICPHCQCSLGRKPGDEVSLDVVTVGKEKGISLRGGAKMKFLQNFRHLQCSIKKINAGMSFGIFLTILTDALIVVWEVGAAVQLTSLATMN